MANKSVERKREQVRPVAIRQKCVDQ